MGNQMALQGGPGETTLECGPQKASQKVGEGLGVLLLVFAPTEPDLSQSVHTKLSLHSHLPFHFLCNLLNPQFIVLSQELQLLVNKSQPVLPLFPHF